MTKQNVSDQEEEPGRESFPELLKSAGGWVKHLKTESRPLPEEYEAFLKRILEVITSSDDFGVYNYECWWRVRMHENQQGACPFHPERMRAPPAHLVRGGRINVEGVPCLYLSESKATGIAEVRDERSPYASVAKFRLVDNLRIADLTVTDHLCSSVYHAKTIKRPVFVRFVFNACSFGLQVMNGDGKGYIPMQHFSERLRSCGYDGIAYESVKTPRGYDLDAHHRGILRLTGVNLALFDPNKANICTDPIEVVRVNPD